MSSKKTHTVQHQKLFDEKNRRTKNWIMTSLPGSVPEIELQHVDGPGENERKREKTIVEAEVVSTYKISVERSQQGEENDEDFQQNSNALKNCFDCFSKLSIEFWAIIFALILFFFFLKDI